MACALILAAVWGTLGGVVVVLIALRLWVVLHSRNFVSRESLSVLVVAGSGGHTTEILRLLGNLSSAYSPRHYIFADTDEMSAHKIDSFELDRADKYPGTMYTTHRIPRSREVQQSWLSTVLTTLYSTLYSLPLTYKLKPDLISSDLYRIIVFSDVFCEDHKNVKLSKMLNCPALLETQQRINDFCRLAVLCNGPGTCVPICMSALLLGILGIKKVIIVYVESICRVETLSLSGKILYHLSDYFIVQWPTLREKYPKSLYLGRIV